MAEATTDSKIADKVNELLAPIKRDIQDIRESLADQKASDLEDVSGTESVETRLDIIENIPILRGHILTARTRLEKEKAEAEKAADATAKQQP